MTPVMRALPRDAVRLAPGMFQQRFELNRKYLMRLTNDNLFAELLRRGRAVERVRAASTSIGVSRHLPGARALPGALAVGGGAQRGGERRHGAESQGRSHRG